MTMKTAMLIILIVIEIPAAVALVWGWFKDCKEAKERKRQ